MTKWLNTMHKPEAIQHFMLVLLHTGHLQPTTLGCPLLWSQRSVHAKMLNNVAWPQHCIHNINRPSREREALCLCQAMNTSNTYCSKYKHLSICALYSDSQCKTTACVPLEQSKHRTQCLGRMIHPQQPQTTSTFFEAPGVFCCCSP